jgi:hypothetical protein
VKRGKQEIPLNDTLPALIPLHPPKLEPIEIPDEQILIQEPPCPTKLYSRTAANYRRVQRALHDKQIQMQNLQSLLSKKSKNRNQEFAHYQVTSMGTYIAYSQGPGNHTHERNSST